MAVKGNYFCDICNLMGSVSRARRSLFGKCVLENNPFKSILIQEPNPSRVLTLLSTA